MISIGQYKRSLMRWIYIAVGIFCAWAVLLFLGGILVKQGIINDTDQYARLNAVSSMIWGLFCGWVASGMFWFLSHKLSKKRSSK
ncbi:hypothetical protein LCGC14_0674610 [marine sediment metagenome]|uniref:Uncharacterized protein n=1 Tax=marine sediment metagenome TaxID=412755 RepID=A0A0F9QUZ2_9ZZZZ